MLFLILNQCKWESIEEKCERIEDIKFADIRIFTVFFLTSQTALYHVYFIRYTLS